MGKRFKSKRKRNSDAAASESTDARGARGDQRPKKDRRSLYYRNDKMIAYYTFQGVFGCPKKLSGGGSVAVDRVKDRRAFIDVVKQPLMASFRVNRAAPQHFKDLFHQQLIDFTSKEVVVAMEDGSTRRIEPAKRIPFVENAYQLDVDKVTIRKNDQLKDFFDFIKMETESGHITRQETVSMVRGRGKHPVQATHSDFLTKHNPPLLFTTQVPPVALEVEPHHSVLDMCAAPGSKTSQILEVVGETPAESIEPSGFIVANDCNVQRAHMLVHQCKRINSSALLVTCHQGQEFPMPAQFRNDGQGNEGIFDRVLCDVPCTGDGTLRKNSGIFKSWCAAAQCSIHRIQVDIAMRGVRLCKVGGLIVYSTCSLSPMENESSVCEILRRSEGAVELVEAKGLLDKGFVAREGMTQWKVLDDRKATVEHFEGMNKTQGQNAADDEGGRKRDQTAFDTPPTYDDSDFAWTEEGMGQFASSKGLYEYKSPSSVPPNLRHAVPESLFPPTLEEKRNWNLHRCMRVMPHDMNTGGFFIAVLRKTKPIGVAKPRKVSHVSIDFDRGINAKRRCE